MDQSRDQALPEVGERLPDDLFILPGGHETSPEDLGIDPSYTNVFSDPADEAALEQLATSLPVLVQRQDSGQEHGERSHQELKAALRETLREQQATGEAQPLAVEIARLANRVKTDAGSVWADLEVKHETWSARVAPALPTLNRDGTVASPATLTKAAGLALALFLFLLLLTTWKLALVWAWVAVAVYVSSPLWRPKAQSTWEAVRKYLEPADKESQD